MFTYTVRFRPFENAFREKTEVLADSRLEAESMVLGLYPHGKILSANVTEATPKLADVIYVDFRARKRLS